MKSIRLTPITLRWVLVIIMVLLTALSVGVFIVGREIIAKHALAAQQTAQAARASNSDIEYLQSMKTTLEKQEAAAEKTAKLISESERYMYQDKIISDITGYANAAGLSVMSIEFSDVKTTGTANTATSTAATVAPPANVKSRIASVTLTNPVDYMQLLTFLHSIEQGVFRMRVSSVGVSKAGEGKGVNTDALTIEVFVR